MDLCSQFSFDAQKRMERLALLGLGDADLPLGKRLQEMVIIPHIDAIVSAFYDKLGTDPGATQFLRDPVRRERLIKTQTEYLLSLGSGFTAKAYFDNRLAVGLVHARVGVPLSLYHCAYCALQLIINRHIDTDTLPEERQRLTDFLLKIATLDMSLAMETYHLTQVNSLEQSIIDLRRQQRSLKKQASIDPLTETVNRGRILHELQTSMKEARDQRHPLSIIMVDLDHFKAINDVHGHQAGDRVLRQVAARMKSVLRHKDALGRYGGEEFLVVLPNTGCAIAREVAERLRHHIAHTPVKYDDILLHTTISLGYTELGERDDISAFIARADKALYNAKRRGRNCVAEPAVT